MHRTHSLCERLANKVFKEYTAQKYNGTKGYIIALDTHNLSPPPPFQKRDAFKLVCRKVICTKLMALEIVLMKYFCNNYANMYKHDF